MIQGYKDNADFAFCLIVWYNKLDYIQLQEWQIWNNQLWMD